MITKKKWTTEDVKKATFSVPIPCDENWDKMSGSEQVKLCDKCNHHVYDFTKMSPDEVAYVLNQTNVKICAKFYKRPDGTLTAYNDCSFTIRNLKMIARAGGVAAIIVFILFKLGLTANDEYSKVSEAVFGKKESISSTD